MDPTTLEFLLKTSDCELLNTGLVVTVLPSWIIPGETHLSYTTIIRLSECCREHHWNKDILPQAVGQPIDAIAKSICGEFVRPIVVNRRIVITYVISNVRDKGYCIKILFKDITTASLMAFTELVCVFYDPILDVVTCPPDNIHRSLLAQYQTYLKQH